MSTLAPERCLFGVVRDRATHKERWTLHRVAEAPQGTKETAGHCTSNEFGAVRVTCTAGHDPESRFRRSHPQGSTGCVFARWRCLFRVVG